MKGINYIWIIALILIVPTVYGEGSIWTGALAPSTANLCGQYANNITLTATNVWNSETFSLNDVSAILIIPDESGLIFLTNQIVDIGNITALSQSSTNPTWMIQCDSDFSGNYTLYVNYSSSNSYTGSSIDQATSLIKVYSASALDPPVVLSHSPTNKITTSYTTLTVTTDEDATCRYSTTSNVDYDDMSDIFDTTGGTTHKESLTGLSDNAYHYYIKCEDGAGNKAIVDYDAGFVADTAPTAQISLSDSSPVKSGTIEVTLTTSEDVKPTPTLKYSLSGSSTIDVPLSGSGSSWEGYMVIESEGNKVGSFKFSAIDLEGNSGTVITRGNTFLVDTIVPSTPTGVNAISRTDGKIKLSWQYSGDEVYYYNIYRSTSPGVSELDFYIEKSIKSFVDTSTTRGTTYYYAVSAVDEAENEGSLSAEVSAISERTTISQSASQTTTATAKLSSELVVKVDDSINSISELIIGINNIKSDFETGDSEDIAYLDVLQQIDDGKTRLNNLKKELEALKSQDLSGDELDDKLKQIDVKKEAVKKDIPKSINVIEEMNFEVDISSEDVQTAIYELLNYNRMGKVEEDKKQDFIRKNEELQELVDVEVNVKLIKIIYLDEAEKEVTLVQKKISIEMAGANNFILVENIPKNVAENVNEIEFKNADYTVIKKDPLVKWEYDKLENGLLNYVINKKVDLEDIKGAKSIILFDIDILKEDYGKDGTKKGFGSVTGFASLNIKSLGSKIRSIVLIIIGMLVIGGLLVYYFVFMGEEETAMMGAPISSKVANIASKMGYRKEDKTAAGLFDHHNYAKEEYSNIGLTNLKSIKLNVLLNKAHKHIDKMEFNPANKIYFLVAQHCNALGIDSQKEKVMGGLTRLYHKLAMYAKINEAQSCIEKGDNLNLHHVLNHLAHHYNELAEDISEGEIKLMSHAWKQHSIHSRELINSRMQLPYRR